MSPGSFLQEGARVILQYVLLLVTLPEIDARGDVQVLLAISFSCSDRLAISLLTLSSPPVSLYF